MAPSTYELEDVLVWASVVGMALGPVVVQCPKAVECQGENVGVGGLVQGITLLEAGSGDEGMGLPERKPVKE